MTVIYDPARRVHTEALPCRSCRTLVYFSFTSGGKRAPFEVDAEGNPTRTLHFLNCPDRERWTRHKRKPA
jgi:hypothetical protein